MSRNQVDEKAASVVTLFRVNADWITNYKLKAAFLSAAAYSIYMPTSVKFILFWFNWSISSSEHK